MKKNIAVVGCGHWGKNLIRNFAERDDLLHPIPLYLAFSLRSSDRRFKSSNFGSPNKLLRSYNDMYSYEDVDD